MPKTVTRLFASLADAKTAVAALEGIGVRYAEISVISGSADGRRRAAPDEHLGDHDRIIGEEAKKGGEGGAAVGTGAGLLAGMALLPIAGLGPVLAVGWLVATLGTAAGGAAIGTAAGGLVATLTHHDIEETDAHLIAEAVRRGDTLVSARVDDAKYEQAEALMDRLNAVNAATRGEPSSSAGLPELKPTTPPLADNKFERSPPAV
jgi:hypothetical protein